MKPSLVALISFLFTISTFGQKTPFKLGKIEPSELLSTVCPIDSEAEAYIIGDYGNLSFNYVDSKGFQTVLQKHIRIKLLKKTSFHWADFVIPLYYSGMYEEKVDGLKGNTFNLENGKVVVSQMEKSAIFKEEVNEHRKNVRFTLPNVKEGSVIEVSYKIYSDFYTIWDWYFQQTIPILKSEYQLEIPEYFNYKKFKNGYENVKLTSNVIPGSVTLTSKERSGAYVTSTSFSSDRIDYQVNVSTYSSENIAAFHDEPYMSSRTNYITSMEFELQSIRMPNSMLKDYTSDWKSINDELLKSESCGVLLTQGGTKDIIDAHAGISSPEAKATAIFEYVRDNIKWNGYNRLYASKSIRKIIEEKSGNSADINLLLVNLLNKSDLKAYPVILSTRDNGMILMEYPVLQKLNYVIACLELDGKRILLDATDKYCSFGFIPEKCLNGHGRIIDKNAEGDVELLTNQKYNLSISATMKLDPNGELSGQWAESRKGYCAYKCRQEIGKTKGIEEFIENIQSKNQGLTINKHEIIDKDSLNKDLKLIYDVAISGKTESTGDLLIVHPMLFEKLEENPFKFEKRNFPIDYSFGYSLTYLLHLDIPSGYKIESLPKVINISMPENGAKFTYLVEDKGNYVQVVRKCNINKAIFLPETYPILKEFYNQMVNKEAEVIVLKKI